MPSKKPTQPPASDFSTMEQAWYDNLKRPDGQPYEVFNNHTLTTWKRWVGGEFEFDGTGLRDVVNANAVMLDTVKDDADSLRDDVNALLQWKAEQEALPVVRPFPEV